MMQNRPILDSAFITALFPIKAPSPNTASSVISAEGSIIAGNSNPIS